MYTVKLKDCSTVPKLILKLDCGFLDQMKQFVLLRVLFWLKLWHWELWTSRGIAPPAQDLAVFRWPGQGHLSAAGTALCWRQRLKPSATTSGNSTEEGSQALQRQWVAFLLCCNFNWIHNYVVHFVPLMTLLKNPSVEKAPHLLKVPTIPLLRGHLTYLKYPPPLCWEATSTSSKVPTSPLLKGHLTESTHYPSVERPSHIKYPPSLCWKATSHKIPTIPLLRGHLTYVKHSPSICWEAIFYKIPTIYLLRDHLI